MCVTPLVLLLHETYPVVVLRGRERVSPARSLIADRRRESDLQVPFARFARASLGKQAYVLSLRIPGSERGSRGLPGVDLPRQPIRPVKADSLER